jgi:hypothetical protein
MACIRSLRLRRENRKLEQERKIASKCCGLGREHRRGAEALFGFNGV